MDDGGLVALVVDGVLGVAVVHQEITALEFGGVVPHGDLHRPFDDGEVLLGPGEVWFADQGGMRLEGHHVHLQLLHHGEWAEDTDRDAVLLLLELRLILGRRVEGEDPLRLIIGFKQAKKEKFGIARRQRDESAVLI